MKARTIFDFIKIVQVAQLSRGRLLVLFSNGTTYVKYEEGDNNPKWEEVDYKKEIINDLKINQ